MPPSAASPAPPTSPLTLRTMGEVGLFAQGNPVPLLGPGKPFALLVYLAITPGRRTSREFLLDLLWADLDPDRARRALRQAVFHLRRLLGEEALSGAEELTLAPTIGVDRTEFLQDLESGRLETALLRYTGHFLPQFGVPGGAAFEHWADLERGRLQIAFTRTADLLVRRYLNESRLREAQRLARHAREIAPEDEGTWRLTLETAIACHDLVAAAVEAEALQAWADREQRTLDPSTRDVVARARGLRPRVEESPRSDGLLVELTGREREFSSITSAWELSRTGRMHHLHLSAPAGMGKSRLLRDACDRLAAGGARVVRLMPKAGDREIPFAFAGDLAHAVAVLPGSAGIAPAAAATLVGLNPALSARFHVSGDTAWGEEALRRRIHALVDLIEAVAHEQPFVLAIDDLHWIDHPSHRVLEGILSRLDAVRLLCLTAARPERQPGNEHCVRLRLTALTPEQLGSLIGTLGILPSDQPWSTSFIAGLHRATGGTPLLVLETLRLAIDQEILWLGRQEWRCLKEDRLQSLLRAGEALRERVRGLPPTQAWLLALLAVAGTSLASDALAIAAELTGPDCRTALDALEHLGLIVGTGTGWSVVHDEIAAASRESLDAVRERAAHRAISRLYARSAAPDDVLRAARHALTAGDAAEVEQLHRRYARMARLRGDRRSFPEITAELVGEEATSTRVQALTRRLPALWRLGLWSGARQAAAALALLALPVATVMLSQARRASEATVQRVMYADSLGQVVSLAVQPSAWNASRTDLRPGADHSAVVNMAADYPDLPPAISPDERSVAWIRDAGDSTTLDIWLHTPGGTRRLTNSPGDDLVQEWLPDGSALVGQTDRWSPAGAKNYDIAIFDTATGLPRQITHGPAQDNSPHVSPDGTRIAFIRTGSDDPPELCVVSIEGGNEPECRLVNGKPIGWLLGWSGLDELVLTTYELEQRPLVRYDWQRDAVTPLLGPQAYRPLLSPDRRWVIASVRVNGAGGMRDMIVPLDDPGTARTVDAPGGSRNALRWWEGHPDASGLIDRLVFSDSVQEVQSGIGTRLAVHPVAAGGLEIPSRVAVRWRSSDTAIATVDSTGEVRVRGNGEVTVTATLAGRLSASKSIRVVVKRPVVEMDEHWDQTWTHRWLPWGDPVPIATAGPGGIHALWNRGDGIYPSLAVSRDAYPGKDGLGMEVRLSTPITHEQHQRLEVMLAADVNFPALAAADQKKAPPYGVNPDLRCGVIFPGENHWSGAHMAVYGGMSGELDLAAAALPLRSGEWWTLRLQLMPDGRCGIAVNGRVIWISPDPSPPGDAYRVVLGRESLGARLLHGPLQVWTGVRSDIRWTAPPK